LFHTNTYSAKLKELISDADSNILVIYGDCDEFTSITKYKAWKEELKGRGDAERLQVVEVPRASHFWEGREMKQIISEWLP
jgi:alpha/beta superfamily hydrolase